MRLVLLPLSHQCIGLCSSPACLPVCQQNASAGAAKRLRWPPGELGLSCCPQSTCTAALGFAEGIACSSAAPRPPPPPSSHWLQLVFPLYCLWLHRNGRCSIFVLHLIIFWRPLDIISHCIGGGLAEMMGDISCPSSGMGFAGLAPSFHIV